MNSRNTKINDTNPKDLIGCNKPPISLVPSSVIIQLAQVFKNGASKYGAYNWREKDVRAMIYIDATMRHVLAWLDGEELAEDSQISHLAHAVGSLSVLIDAKESGNLIDDRPKKGPAARLIKEFNQINTAKKIAVEDFNVLESLDDVPYIESLDGTREEEGSSVLNHEFCLQTRKSGMSSHNSHLEHLGDCPDKSDHSNESQ